MPTPSEFLRVIREWCCGRRIFRRRRINWRPKAENIRQLAAELNLGLDSFVFIDDSPHEREAMRRLAPEVTTPELPDDPAQRPAWLRRLTCTWPVRLTQEDETRAEMYAANRRAEEAKALRRSIWRRISRASSSG